MLKQKFNMITRGNRILKPKLNLSRKRNLKLSLLITGLLGGRH